MGQPRPLFRLFSVFSNKHYNFYNKIYEKCPSSIQCRDSNPRPLKRESLPITTRPGLPPKRILGTMEKHHCLADLLFILFHLPALLSLNERQFYLFGKIQTSQTGGQLYSDTSPHGERSTIFI